MARYIDADALKERLNLVGAVTDNLYGMGINRGLDRAETEIDMLPTADVVPVVRCKDCEHYDKGGCKHFGYHTYTPDVDEDDFCSYGRRKDEISKATDS